MLFRPTGNRLVESVGLCLGSPKRTLGVIIEQGMLGKNGAVRSITPGNEVGLEDQF